MQSIFFFDAQSHVYYTLWSKYRPWILKMMIAADETPQQYKFYKHEFRARSASQKSFSFILQIVNGKATNATKLPAIAKDLLTVLQYSRKATELMQGRSFEFKLDSKFQFHVTMSKEGINA